MSTLVYFASGLYREEYLDLPFNKIYLIDVMFKKGFATKSRNSSLQNNIYQLDKITCVGMDCLESIEFLRKEEVKIDYFVSLNEGLFEGGGQYAINSDMFLGYAMPLFKNLYFHIMNQNYYCKSYRVTMDLPYKKEEKYPGNVDYLRPTLFSKDDYQKDNAKVYKMLKMNNETVLNLNTDIKVIIKNDSIWNYYNELDLLGISITSQGQGNFFEKIPKVISVINQTFEEILKICVQNKIHKIGLTPWLHGNYISIPKKLNAYKGDFPKEIILFHLNKGDYQDLKKVCC